VVLRLKNEAQQKDSEPEVLSNEMKDRKILPEAIDCTKSVQTASSY